MIFEIRNIDSLREKILNPNIPVFTSEFGDEEPFSKDEKECTFSIYTNRTPIQGSSPFTRYDFYFGRNHNDAIIYTEFNFLQRAINVGKFLNNLQKSEVNFLVSNPTQGGYFSSRGTVYGQVRIIGEDEGRRVRLDSDLQRIDIQNRIEFKRAVIKHLNITEKIIDAGERANKGKSIESRVKRAKELKALRIRLELDTLHNYELVGAKT